MGEQIESPERITPLGFTTQVIFVLCVVAVMGGFLGIRQYTNENPRFCESCHEIAPEIGLWLESEHRDVHCQACHHSTVREGLAILWVFMLGEMPDIRHAEVSVPSCASCHASHDQDWAEVANSSGHRAHTTAEGLKCTDCHGDQMHFGQPAREVCMGCHEGQDIGPAHEPSHCLACHDFLSLEEELRPDSQDCLDCHLKQEIPILLPPTAPMHFVCVGCHEPHAAGRIAPCADCHESPEVCGLHEHPDHQLCADCHQPHEWTSRRHHCFTCHEGLFTHHPEKRCEDCHSFKTEGCEALKVGPTL